MRVVVACLVLAGCGEARMLLDEGRYSREDIAAALDDPTSSAGYVIGEFALRPGAVVDGDTIKVEGLDASLRLLALDTEETFKHEDELRAFESMEFPAYLKWMAGDSGHPPKGPTPLGMDAKHFAEDFFADVTRVRLERDHPKEIRGRYNRHLAYVLVEKDGKWVNYNVECVRAGMSPYYTKYGYSRRFHDEFVRAQQQARAAGRGIWEEGAPHYDDYPLRLAWWDARAEFIAQFEAAAEGREDHIVLTNWDAPERLEQMRGEWVHVLATVGEVRPRQGRAPARVMLSRRLFQDFPVITFDDDVLEDSGVLDLVGEYVVVQGRVAKYTYKSRSKRKAPESQLQIELKSADQVTRSPGFAGVVGRFGTDEPADRTAPEDEPTPDPAPDPEPADETSDEAPPAADPTGEPDGQPTPSVDEPSDVPPPPPPPPPASRP